MIHIERNFHYMFSVLAKPVKTTDQSAHLWIPDTLFYQHGTLRLWYYTDAETVEVSKRDKRECTKEKILELLGADAATPPVVIPRSTWDVHETDDGDDHEDNNGQRRVPAAGETHRADGDDDNDPSHDVERRRMTGSGSSRSVGGQPKECDKGDGVGSASVDGRRRKTLMARSTSSLAASVDLAASASPPSLAGSLEQSAMSGTASMPKPAVAMAAAMGGAKDKGGNSSKGAAPSVVVDPDTLLPDPAPPFLPVAVLMKVVPRSTDGTSANHHAHHHHPRVTSPTASASNLLRQRNEWTDSTGINGDQPVELSEFEWSTVKSKTDRRATADSVGSSSRRGGGTAVEATAPTLISPLLSVTAAGHVVTTFPSSSSSSAAVVAVPSSPSGSRPSAYHTSTDFLEPNGVPVEVIAMQFLDRDGLQGFLNSRSDKHNVLIQRFIHGRTQYATTTQVVWSPHRVVITQRRNIHYLRDSKVPLFERCNSMESGAHTSREMKVTPRMTSCLKRECERMVAHVFAVEQKHILRMVAFFAFDEGLKPRLLWVPEVQLTVSPMSTTEANHLMAAQKRRFLVYISPATCDAATMASASLVGQSAMGRSGNVGGAIGLSSVLSSTDGTTGSPEPRAESPARRAASAISRGLSGGGRQAAKFAAGSILRFLGSNGSAALAELVGESSNNRKQLRSSAARGSSALLLALDRYAPATVETPLDSARRRAMLKPKLFQYSREALDVETDDTGCVAHVGPVALSRTTFCGAGIRQLPIRSPALNRWSPTDHHAADSPHHPPDVTMDATTVPRQVMLATPTMITVSLSSPPRHQIHNGDALSPSSEHHHLASTTGGRSLPLALPHATPLVEGDATLGLLPIAAKAITAGGGRTGGGGPSQFSFDESDSLLTALMQLIVGRPGQCGQSSETSSVSRGRKAGEGGSSEATPSFPVSSASGIGSPRAILNDDESEAHRHRAVVPVLSFSFVWYIVRSLFSLTLLEESVEEVLAVLHASGSIPIPRGHHPSKASAPGSPAPHSLKQPAASACATPKDHQNATFSASPLQRRGSVGSGTEESTADVTAERSAAAVSQHRSERRSSLARGGGGPVIPQPVHATVEVSAQNLFTSLQATHGFYEAFFVVGVDRVLKLDAAMERVVKSQHRRRRRQAGEVEAASPEKQTWGVGSALTPENRPPPSPIDDDHFPATTASSLVMTLLCDASASCHEGSIEAAMNHPVLRCATDAASRLVDGYAGFAAGYSANSSMYQRVLRNAIRLGAADDAALMAASGANVQIARQLGSSDKKLASIAGSSSNLQPTSTSSVGGTTMLLPSSSSKLALLSTATVNRVATQPPSVGSSTMRPLDEPAKGTDPTAAADATQPRFFSLSPHTDDRDMANGGAVTTERRCHAVTRLGLVTSMRHSFQGLRQLINAALSDDYDDGSTPSAQASATSSAPNGTAAAVEQRAALPRVLQRSLGLVYHATLQSLLRECAASNGVAVSLLSGGTVVLRRGCRRRGGLGDVTLGPGMRSAGVPVAVSAAEGFASGCNMVFPHADAPRQRGQCATLRTLVQQSQVSRVYLLTEWLAVARKSLNDELAHFLSLQQQTTASLLLAASRTAEAKAAQIASATAVASSSTNHSRLRQRGASQVRSGSGSVIHSRGGGHQSPAMVSSPNASPRRGDSGDASEGEGGTVVWPQIVAPPTDEEIRRLGVRCAVSSSERWADAADGRRQPPVEGCEHRGGVEEEDDDLHAAGAALWCVMALGLVSGDQQANHSAAAAKDEPRTPRLLLRAADVAQFATLLDFVLSRLQRATEAITAVASLVHHQREYCLSNEREHATAGNSGSSPSACTGPHTAPKKKKPATTAEAMLELAFLFRTGTADGAVTAQLPGEGWLFAPAPLPVL